MERTPQRSWATRLLYFVPGVVCLGLGVVATFVPLVPTTPFVLLAAYCFARSSERLTRWLRGHPTFGLLISAWEDGRRIPAWAKPRALALIAASFALSIGVVPVLWVKFLLLPIGAGVMLFVGRLPVV